MRNPTTDPIVRFLKKINLSENGCWLWNASTHKDGYGWFGPGGRGRVMLAHRWSYQYFSGEIPEGMYVLHTCDEPSCVNPQHLFLGTQADNVRDCAGKGRRNQVRYHKLTQEQRDEICRLYATGEFTFADLGRRFGVQYTTIARHVKRRVQAELFPEGV